MAESSPDGRVVEVLSEHMCQGWLEGYLLTGRHGLFSCYEAFIHIIDSMFNQHAKWLKTTNDIPWRRPIASLNYLLTSHVWRQDHNGFSHQDPGFIDHVVNKKADIVRVYLPPDANTLLSVADHCLRSRQYVNVIVAGKQPALQFLDMDAAVQHCTAGIGIWKWASNDEVKVDQAAVDAMRRALDGVDMHGVVVIGEGEKDEAPMLYIGEEVGNGMPPEVDVAVDPVDGTRLTSLGLPGAIAVVATAERGSMYSAPPGVYYMEKIAVGPAARDVIDINAPIATNLEKIARARNAHIDDLTVVILDRERHKEIIRQVREAGARIRLIMDGDVSAAIQAAMEDYKGVDVLLGTGGAPEAVLAAAAIKCIGGAIQCKIWPRNDEEREKLKADGIDLEKVYTTDDLVKGEDVAFAATGITSGELVDGVQYFGWGARTSSVMMRSHSGTVRYIQARHKWRAVPDSVQSLK